MPKKKMTEDEIEYKAWKEHKFYNPDTKRFVKRR